MDHEMRGERRPHQSTEGGDVAGSIAQGLLSVAILVVGGFSAIGACFLWYVGFTRSEDGPAARYDLAGALTAIAMLAFFVFRILHRRNVEAMADQFGRARSSKPPQR